MFQSIGTPIHDTRLNRLQAHQTITPQTRTPRIRPSPSQSSLSKILKMPSSTGTVLLYFLAIWIPFLPVLLRRGCSADFLINVLLCCLGWIPGVIHAWYIISQTERHPDSMGRPDGKRY
ncbi:hypothetical protein K458DRAFT_335735 [Lentithecium fluviatile CBS 122367]|uniref:Uncharacterized protein n=1 Tax=Lentithecium fluviatile CBS 122367 TaxID=1168545 RepID=A0A6G1J7W7_9PLEO|nr:hypothetical protein K458DRAFT_335735 [Lentithecium fluviatile CBS 122367]